MNDYLVGWFVGVLHVRACVRFGFAMWQATHLLLETMTVMRGFLDDAYAAQDAGKGKDAKGAAPRKTVAGGGEQSSRNMQQRV